MSIKSKIVWINPLNKISGTQTNFMYNIAGAIPLNAKNIKVRLVHFLLPNNLYEINGNFIKVYCDFGCSHNQYNINFNNSFLLLDCIMLNRNGYYLDNANANTSFLLYSCEKSIHETKLYYEIGKPSDLINFLIYTDLNTDLTTTDINALKNSTICLKFEYEI